MLTPDRVSTSAESQVVSQANMSASCAALTSLTEHFHADHLEYVAQGDISHLLDIAGAVWQFFDKVPDRLRRSAMAILGVSTHALKLIEKFIPRPDLTILLDAPAEILEARKQEVSAEESARQREKYHAVLSKLPECVIVDANQPLERVFADTKEAILNFLDRRTRKDLRTLRAP